MELFIPQKVEENVEVLHVIPNNTVDSVCVSSALSGVFIASNKLVHSDFEFDPSFPFQICEVSTLAGVCDALDSHVRLEMTFDRTYEQTVDTPTPQFAEQVNDVSKNSTADLSEEICGRLPPVNFRVTEDSEFFEAASWIHYDARRYWPTYKLVHTKLSLSVGSYTWALEERRPWCRALGEPPVTSGSLGRHINTGHSNEVLSLAEIRSTSSGVFWPTSGRELRLQQVRDQIVLGLVALTKFCSGRH